jgi:asparagine synthase (glutamine-hydrolysing)
MCGIAGYFSPSGRFNKEHLEQATSSLQHRGPDAGGTYFESFVGLGHRRLSILDLSEGANQPMMSGNNRFVIAYNGEVFNFKEIAEEIKKFRPDIEFKTSSDTEIIIEAFALWRQNMVNMLNGMFAIAIYDRDHDSLHIFRDRLGIKPLYFYWDDRDFFFASELKAFKALKGAINFELNEHALPYFFHLGFIPEPHSIYKNIYKFPAASYLKLNKHGFEISDYWSPASKLTSELMTDEKKSKQQLKELLVSSVTYRMISDVPFGTFLSGGIDSSLVTAVAQSISNVPVKTFSIGFDQKEHSEGQYAAAVASYLKTDHHAFDVSQQDAIDLVDSLDQVYDEPYADTSAIPTMLVAKLARKYVTMTLSGDGGDELFMGYGAHRWAERFSNPLIAGFRKPIQMALSMGNNRTKRVAHLFEAYARENIQSNIFSQEQNMFFSKELKRILNLKGIDEITYMPLMHELKRKLSAKEAQALFDIYVYLKDDLLVKVDRATMQHSLETRVPLLDYRIVEFALNLDENLKIKGNVSKYLLKELLYDYVPKSYFDRPKRGFSIPMHIWLRHDFKAYAEKYVTKEMCERYGIVKWDYAQKIYKHFYKDKLDLYYNRLWLIISIHKFMERNF